MREGPLLVLCFLACGPGPTTTEPATPPAPSSSITPTRAIAAGPDCNAKAMQKLASTIVDAGMRSDIDASVEQEEAQPADATAVLQKLAPKLTACNQAEIEGCAFFTTTVETDGTVSAVELFVSDALPRDVIDCLSGVLKEARYAAVPKAGKMTVPVSFTRGR